MLGFLNLNKPSGLTSHDCVAKVRRLLKTKKVGHGGTLDPLATGVLPIAVGKATRLLPYLPTHKAYQAKVRFGVTTTTDDLEGEIIQQQTPNNLSLSQVKAVLPQFIGNIEQIPPAYSAISVGGKRLYELARKGETVDVPLRNVSVTQIDVVNWYPGEFPEVELAIACGPGTYIRAIARDLGYILGCGATTASLIRTQSCGFSLTDSLSFTDLAAQVESGTFIPISPTMALDNLPSVFLSPDLIFAWRNGQNISLESVSTPIDNSTVKVISSSQDFLGIGYLTITETDVILVPKLTAINSS